MLPGSLRGKEEEQEGEGGIRGGALLAQQSKPIAEEGRDERGDPARPPKPGGRRRRHGGWKSKDPQRQMKIEERKDRRQRLAAADQARDGLDVNRVNREEESGCQRGRRPNPFCTRAFPPVLQPMSKYGTL